MNERITQAVFKSVLARPALDVPGLVHLTWRAPTLAEGWAVQIYVDDALYDVVTEASLSETWLTVDAFRGHRVELLAVADDVWRPRCEALEAWRPRVIDAVASSLMRDETLPVDARVRVTIDGVSHDAGLLWSGDAGRNGFGALFGIGGFGFDDATGPGLGGGPLGHGPLGSDGLPFRFVRRDVSPGSHTVAVTATDAVGRVITESLNLGTIEVDPIPAPPAAFTIDPDFTLRWSL